MAIILALAGGISFGSMGTLTIAGRSAANALLIASATSPGRSALRPRLQRHPPAS